MSNKQLTDVDWLAQRLGLNTQRAYDHIRQGRIPGVLKLGRRVLVDPEVVEAWLSREMKLPE